MIGRILIFYFLLFFVLTNHVFSQKGFVYRDGEILRDYAGRMILLRGLNYVNKDEKNNYRNLIKDTAFIKMKSWGFNAVRLGINWSALEPSPGKYDTDYLQDLDLRLQYAKQYGIYVILDMHQDLYGKKFGGGAPPPAVSGVMPILSVLPYRLHSITSGIMLLLPMERVCSTITLRLGLCSPIDIGTIKILLVSTS